MLTKKEQAELNRPQRKLMLGRKGTRKEVERARELEQKRPVSITPIRSA